VADSAHTKKRRGERVFIRVPVEVRGITEEGAPHSEGAHTGVVGQFGAMIHCSHRLRLRSQVEVINRFSQRAMKFRVAWIGEQGKDGFWDIGLEAVGPIDDFWGVRFPSKHSDTP